MGRKVLVCPFGDINLLVSLGEALKLPRYGSYDVAYLSFTQYDRAVFASLKVRHFHLSTGTSKRQLLNAEEVHEVTEFSRKLCRLHWGDERADELVWTAQHYAAQLAALIDTEHFDAALYFNGRMNLVVSALAKVSQQRGLERLVFEQGLFRPGHLTLDGRGVNYHNSVDSLEGLMASAPYAYQTTKLYQSLADLLEDSAFEVVDHKGRTDKWRLAMAYLRMKITARGRIHLLNAEARDLAEATMFEPKRAEDSVGLATFEKFAEDPNFTHLILCPLQVQTDTQILLYSPLLQSMQSLVDAVSGAVHRYNRSHGANACVLFKLHPMDTRTVVCNDDLAAVIAAPSVRDILAKRCDLVITVNSTVGIEAIEAGVPVVTTGQAFYNFQGVVSGHCRNLADLPELIHSALRPTGNRELQLRQAFIRQLRGKYQIKRGW